MHDANSVGPITLATGIRFQDPLPEAVDVAIIGGGVIGIFTALYLNRRGLRVLVCEKGRIAGEQSSRNWGWVRKQGRDPAELPIMMEADHLWDAVDEQAGGRTGLTRGGICYLASTDKELERHAEWLEIAGTHQVEARLFSKAEIAKLIDQSPAGSGPAHGWAGGIVTPTDGRAEPWQAVPVVAELAHSEGVLIRENCAVRSLDIEAGQIKALVTEDGIVKTEQVVLAAGAWSSLFARQHAISIPQLSVRATVARTAPLPEVYAGNGADEDLAFRRREDGSYTLAPSDYHEHFIGPDSVRNFFKYLPVMKHNLAETGLRLSAPKDYPDAWGTKRGWASDDKTPFEAMRVLDPDPNQTVIKKLQKRFAERFPAIGMPAIQTSWAGMIDSMPDVVPIVDRVPALEGLLMATGMSGHGFGIGPGFGKVIADMAMGKESGHDLSRFRFSRFSDGSRIRIGPTL